MQASNKPQRPDPAAFGLVDARFSAAVRAMWDGALGRTVRCVPTRRTVMAEVGGGVLFGKWRRGARRDAAAEWHWLHVLPLLGLRTPVPVAWFGAGRRSLLVTEGVRGRGMDAWWCAAAAEGWTAELLDYAVREVAPRVRALHERRVAYRDLYWNHIVVEDPRRGTPPVFLDVERLFQPRCAWERWRIKDLAGLVSSLPPQVPWSLRGALRFLRACGGTPLRGQRRTIAAVQAKAARIRGHQPKYG